MQYYCVAVQPQSGEFVDFTLERGLSRDRTDEVLRFLQEQVSWTVVHEDSPVLTESGEWTELGEILDWAFGSIEFIDGVLRFHGEGDN